MDLGLAFSFPTRDRDWLKKIGIAGLIQFLPIVGQLALLGWGLEITRRVMRNDPQPLADWTDLAGHLVRGVKMAIIQAVYALPIIVPLLCLAAVSAAAGGDQEAASGALGLLISCFACLAILYGLALAFVIPAAVGALAATDDIGAALDLRRVLGTVSSNLGTYVLVFVGYIVAGLLASLGIILCVIGLFFTMAYATAVQYHLYGQAYTAAAGTAGPAAPMSPTPA
jgi:hypothetical protein